MDRSVAAAKPEGWSLKSQPVYGCLTDVCMALCFQDCIHFTCTQDINSCMALGPTLDRCPDLKGVTEAVRASCYEELTST